MEGTDKYFVDSVIEIDCYVAMIETMFRFNRILADGHYQFSNVSDDSLVNIPCGDIDSSEFVVFVPGNEYLALCDDQDFWRFTPK